VLIGIFIALIYAPLNSFAQSEILSKKIRISFHQTPISAALKDLENQINRTFSYNSNQIDKNKKITKSYSNHTVKQILDEILDYRIADIKSTSEKIIFRLEEKSPWKGKISGVLLSQDSLTLSGITVILHPLALSTTTDHQGAFEFPPLEAGNYSLEFQSIHYQKSQQAIQLSPTTQPQVYAILKPVDYHLDVVTITGQRETDRLKKTGFSMNAIELKSQANSSRDLNQVLNTSTGIRIRESGGLGSDFDFSINGLAGKAVRFFIDGIPMENFGVGMQFNNIPVNLADRVEVFKGVVPISLGSDALGGGVNMVTQKGNHSYIDASYSVGSFQTHRAALNSQFIDHKKGVSLSLNGFYNFSKNNYWMHSNPKYEAAITVPDGKGGFEERSVKRFNDEFQSSMIQGKIALIEKPWADKFSVGLLYNEHYKEFQTGANQNIVYGHVNRKGDFLMPSVSYEKRNFLTEGLSINLIANLGIDKYHVADTSTNTYWWDGSIASSGNSYGEISKGSPISLKNFENKFYLVRANMEYALHDHHRLSLNYNFSKADQESSELLKNISYDPAKLKKQVVGISLRSEFLEQRLITTLFSKYYNFNVGLGDRQILVNDKYVVQDMDNQYSNFGYGLASRFQLLKRTGLRLSYEHAYRLPEQVEVLGNGINIVANYDLKPENSHNINLGADHAIYFAKNTALAIDFSGFYRKATNLIYSIPWGNNSSKFLNERQINVAGFETELRFKQQDFLEITANATYQKSIQNQKYIYGTQTEYATYKNVLPNQPWFFGNLLISVGKNNLIGKDTRLQLDWSSQYVHWFYLTWEAWGSKNSLNQIPTQFTHNLAVNYSLKNGRYNVSAESRNLTDQLTYDSFRLQKPGRSFYLKFRYFLQQH